MKRRTAGGLADWMNIAVPHYEAISLREFREGFKEMNPGWRGLNVTLFGDYHLRVSQVIDGDIAIGNMITGEDMGVTPMRAQFTLVQPFKSTMGLMDIKVRKDYARKREIPLDDGSVYPLFNPIILCRRHGIELIGEEEPQDIDQRRIRYDLPEVDGMPLVAYAPRRR